MVTSREAEFQGLDQPDNKLTPGSVPEFNQTMEEKNFIALQKVREEFTGLEPVPYEFFKNTVDEPDYYYRKLPQHARAAAENGSCVVRCGLNANYLANDRETQKWRQSILEVFQTTYGINRYQIAFCSAHRLVGDDLQAIFWMDINFG